MLWDSPRGLLMARNELAGWFMNFDQYRSGKGGDLAHWLAMYGARDLLIDRKMGDKPTISVRHAAVSITGGIQPEILRRVLGREHFDDGLAARMLLAMPPRKPKQWTDAVIPEDAELALSRAFERLWGLQLGRVPNDEPCPIAIPLGANARRAWIEFYNAHAQEQADLSGHLAAAWSKLEGYAVRLSLLTHFVR